MESSLFDLNNLTDIKSRKALYVEALKGGWYRNVVYLGDEADIPILSMTCTTTDMDNFKSGKFSVRPPGKYYVNTMVTGLVEGNQLSEEEAIAYVKDATTKALSAVFDVWTQADTADRSKEASLCQGSLRKIKADPPGRHHYSKKSMGSKRLKGGSQEGQDAVKVSARSKKRWANTVLPSIVEIADEETPHEAATVASADRPAAQAKLSGAELLTLLSDPLLEGDVDDVVPLGGQALIRAGQVMVKLERLHDAAIRKVGEAELERDEAVKQKSETELKLADLEREKAEWSKSLEAMKKRTDYAEKAVNDQIQQAEEHAKEAAQQAVDAYKQSDDLVQLVRTDARPYFYRGIRAGFRYVEAAKPRAMSFFDMAFWSRTRDPYEVNFANMHSVIPFEDGELEMLQRKHNDWTPPSLAADNMDAYNEENQAADQEDEGTENSAMRSGSTSSEEEQSESV